MTEKILLFIVFYLIAIVLYAVIQHDWDLVE